jgi:pimeloyl-ACP methyl ester carboxylesterase
MKVPLLCLPGLLCTEVVWSESIAALGRDVQCARFAADDTVQAIARGVLAAAPARFAVAGLSMGGYIALEMLRQAPDRIAGLCLVDTAPGADSDKQVAARYASVEQCRLVGMQVFAEKLGRFILYSDADSQSPALQRFVAMADEVGCETFAAHQHAISRRPDSTELLSRLCLPTAVVVGAADRVTPSVVAQRMATAISGATYHLVERAGHLVPLEQSRQMQEILAILLDRCDAG